LKNFKTKSQEKGLTIIPVRIFINDRGLAKMEIALGRGKKNTRQATGFEGKRCKKRNSANGL